MPNPKRGITFLLAAAAAIFLASCVRNPATHKVHARLLSVEAEKKIGLESKKEIIKQYRVFQSTAVQAYVDRVGQKLAMVSDRPSIDFDFTILDSDMVNAFAVPGGYIFVTRGLLDNLEDEAELAMVLAHEISHVAALHGVQMIQKEMGQNALTILGTIGAALVAGPEAMVMVANTANLFSSLYMLGYSREMELQADNLGLQYMLRAGYDPQAALRFMQQLEKGEGEKVSGWDLYFRTHPTTDERISILEHMIGPQMETEATVNRKVYQEMKALLPSVSVKERGQIVGHEYLNDVHRLHLIVPENWMFVHLLPQALVSLKTKDDKGEGHLYVVKMDSMTKTAADAVHDFGKNAGFQFINGRDVLYNAGYGYMGNFEGASAFGKYMDIKLFATVHFGVGYILWCGAPIEQADSYRLDIEQILRGFKFDYL